MSDPAKQREFATDVVRTLRERGFVAYWAGGCVRDQLLGRTAKDYDVATSAKPDEVRTVFGRRRTLPIGAAFGVITVVGPQDAGQIEVATFRQDAAYSDGRHPDAVTFSTPEEDAQRRDFTINGMFYDPLAQQVIDFVGGRGDLEGNLIRAIGEPRERFTEDKLRMLRAVRFAAGLDFGLEPATLQAIQEMAAEIRVVSAERIAMEMRRMLVHAGRARALRLLAEGRLLEHVLPELAALDGRTWQQALDVIGALAEPSFALSLAAVLHLAPDPVGVASVLRQRWKLSNKESERTTWLVMHRDALQDARAAYWPRLQRVLIADGIEDLLALHSARAVAGLAAREDVDCCRELLLLPPEKLNPPPLLTGNDLIEHGVPRGKIFADLLEKVRDAQLEGRITTKEEALAFVDELLSGRAG